MSHELPLPVKHTGVSSTMTPSLGIQVGKEVSKFMKTLKFNGDWSEFKTLKIAKTLTSLYWILRSIIITAFSTWLVLNYPLTVLLVTPFVARSIRSFGNQGHDGSHGNIFGNKLWDGLILNYFLMPLMWYEKKIYCKEHKDHHEALGSKEDPDVIHYQVKIKPTDSDWYAFWKVLKPWLLNFKVWLRSTFGDLFTMGKESLYYVLVWWGTLSFIIWIFFGSSALGYFLLTWILTRTTVYHFIKVFAELCDHAFLNPSSIITYTRSMPKNWLSFFLHPENDNFHIAHHLFPKIPMPNLPKAHRLLMKIDEYKNGQHLTSYFFGKKSVLKALIGRI